MKINNTVYIIIPAYNERATISKVINEVKKYETSIVVVDDGSRDGTEKLNQKKQELTINEVFFFASMIHLVFVKIHPWNDGNGRSARLIEKWFLAQKLGKKAWFVQSEKNYYQQHQTYYKNIRLLGMEYPDLNYSKALPFLLMLPNSLQQK